MPELTCARSINLSPDGTELWMTFVFNEPLTNEVAQEYGRELLRATSFCPLFLKVAGIYEVICSETFIRVICC